jgi:nucleoside-diphosphate-sugar epimerase
MVVGNGLIANAFQCYRDNTDIILFASGVSNSKELDDNLYRKEFDLLKTFVGNKSKLIYFSTCSIYDSSLSDSKYIFHKLTIEKFIRDNFERFIIFRLPNVVGATNNNNTFFNFFRNKLKNFETVKIQKDGVRYLIDIDDLVLYLPLIIDSKSDNCSINVSFDNKLKIIEIIEIMEEILKIKSKKLIIEGGCDYNIDNHEFKKLTKISSFNNNYNYELLKKYLINK